MTGRVRAVLSGHGGLAVDLLVMAVAGAFFAAIGPFDTDTAPAGQRTAYWMAVMLIGGLVVDGAEQVVRALRTGLPAWAHAGLTALAATPVQTGVVTASGSLIFGYRPRFEIYLELLPAVLIVTLAAIALMRLARRAVIPAPAARAAAAPDAGPAPPPAEIAARLPAKLRGAALIALQAEDHYVRVHTAAGSDLILMRFSDAVALAEAACAGFRLHRSWWAGADAIKSVTYSRGSGAARLSTGVNVPVSRTYAPALREAGLL